ncbi:hypothetical protein [Paraburkholderia sartisoli]|uniref:hypothetical protein n=1 Tax=Paraburkholderia sartisoli TaxID=83784 RepID=UPI00116018AB|nr:hypothetical protein [Paraburkholderia sartisoli]
MIPEFGCAYNGGPERQQLRTAECHHQSNRCIRLASSHKNHRCIGHETLNPNDSKFGRKWALTHTKKRLADLLAYVLTDAMTDIEVAARDLQISDASFVRLRRAMDRVGCAQMRVGSVGSSRDETALRVRMREAVVLLAREWPEEYPAWAVELEILRELSKRRQHLLYRRL